MPSPGEGAPRRAMPAGAPGRPGAAARRCPPTLPHSGPMGCSDVVVSPCAMVSTSCEAGRGVGGPGVGPGSRCQHSRPQAKLAVATSSPSPPMATAPRQRWRQQQAASPAHLLAANVVLIGTAHLLQPGLIRLLVDCASREGGDTGSACPQHAWRMAASVGSMHVPLSAVTDCPDPGHTGWRTGASVVFGWLEGGHHSVGGGCVHLEREEIELWLVLPGCGRRGADLRQARQGGAGQGEERR